MISTVTVSQLRAGDVLTSGAKVISDPFSGVRTPKGQVEIGIEYSNGQRVKRFWNRNTTVGVIVPEA